MGDSLSYLNNLLYVYNVPYVYLCDFAKTWSPGFRLDSGEARIKAKQLATQNLGGGGGGGGGLRQG